MAGQGDSDMPPEPYDADSLALTLYESLHQVIPEDERFGLAGFSFGSVIGAVLSARLGDRLDYYVGVGSAGYGPRPTTADALRPARRHFSLAEAFDTHRHNVDVLMLADPAKNDALATTIQMANAGRNRIQSRPISLTDAMPLDPPYPSANRLYLGRGRCHGVRRHRQICRDDPRTSPRGAGRDHRKGRSLGAVRGSGGVQPGAAGVDRAPAGLGALAASGKLLPIGP